MVCDGLIRATLKIPEQLVYAETRRAPIEVVVEQLICKRSRVPNHATVGEVAPIFLVVAVLGSEGGPTAS